MSGEDETTCVKLTALERINEPKQINESQPTNQLSFATASDKKLTGDRKDSNQKWRWIKVRPMSAGSMLDECKNALYKCSKVALLSAVVVVMLLPTVFYHLPLPVSYSFMYVCSISGGVASVPDYPKFSPKH